MAQKLTVGGECVAFCTKCRLDLGHRIIAMVGGVPVKVECRTCGSHHKYRRPAEERAAQTRTRSSTASSTRSTPGGGASRSVSVRAATEAAAEVAREREWQARIAGQGVQAFANYSPARTFEADALVRHSRFGDGYVIRIIDSHKIEVMFKDGPRVLAQGLTLPN